MRGLRSPPIDAAKDREPPGALVCCGCLGSRLRAHVRLYSARRIPVLELPAMWLNVLFLRGKVARNAVLTAPGRASRPRGNGAGYSGVDPGRRGCYRAAVGVGTLDRVGVLRFRRTCHAALPSWQAQSQWLAAEIADAGWDPTVFRAHSVVPHQTRSTAMGSQPSTRSTLGVGDWGRGTRGRGFCLGWGPKQRAR